MSLKEFWEQLHQNDGLLSGGKDKTEDEKPKSRLEMALEKRRGESQEQPQGPESEDEEMVSRPRPIKQRPIGITQRTPRLR